MERILNETSVWIGLVGGFLVRLLGGWDPMLLTLSVLAVLDYLSGVVKAVYHKRLSSEIGFRGILKKIGIFLIIAAASAAQRAVGGLPLREMAMMFFIANEGISVLENVAQLGLPIPERMKNVLLKLRGEQTEREEHDDDTGN